MEVEVGLVFVWGSDGEGSSAGHDHRRVGHAVVLRGAMIE